MTSPTERIHGGIVAIRGS